MAEGLFLRGSDPEGGISPDEVYGFIRGLVGSEPWRRMRNPSSNRRAYVKAVVCSGDEEGDPTVFFAEMHTHPVGFAARRRISELRGGDKVTTSMMINIATGSCSDRFAVVLEPASPDGSLSIIDGSKTVRAQGCLPPHYTLEVNQRIVACMVKDTSAYLDGLG